MKDAVKRFLPFILAQLPAPCQSFFSKKNDYRYSHQRLQTNQIFHHYRVIIRKKTHLYPHLGQQFFSFLRHPKQSQTQQSFLPSVLYE